MNLSYNLVDQPFVPCLMCDGATCELGLRETLERAPDIREVRDQSPLVTAALHRLLLAVLHRNFGPQGLADWKQLWARGSWDQTALEAYWRDWRDRFDLFHPQWPFYQTAEFQTSPPSSVSRLAHELASGNNATLFDHTLDCEPPVLKAAEAGRLLIANQAFALGGGKSDTGYTSHAPLVAGAVAFSQGRTLFETLMLNLIACNASEPFPADGDAPVWERDGRPPNGGSTSPNGYLDYLTWQSRTIALHPESQAGQLIIRRVSYAQGRRLDKCPLADPMMAYRRDRNHGWMALRLTESRELWRDSAALFQAWGDAAERRPLALNWLARLVQDGVLSAGTRYDLAIFGLCSEQARVSFWRHERMPLPLAYLNDETLVATLRCGLKEAEAVGKSLSGAVGVLASAILSPDGNADRKRVQNLTSAWAADRLYWSRLELPFRLLLVHLADKPEDRDRHLVLATWVADELLGRARDAFEETAAGLDQRARILRAVSLARRQLVRALRTVERPYQEALHEPSP